LQGMALADIVCHTQVEISQFLCEMLFLYTFWAQVL
jgi:hypothetical protein